MEDKCNCYVEDRKLIGYTQLMKPIYKTVSRCYGTKERDECSCSGDKTKCDFYSEKRAAAQSKNGTILKSNVESIISSHIRAYAIDNTKQEVVLALYKLFDAVDDMPVQEANWLRDLDGAWRCSHCGYRFFNGANLWHDYCNECGYTMVKL